MDDVLDRLRGLAEPPPTSPEPLDRLRGRAARLRRRRRWAGGMIGLVVAVGCAGGVTAVLRDTTEPAPVAVEVGGPTTTGVPTTTATTGPAPPSTVAISAPSRSPAWTVPNPAGGRFGPTAGRPEVFGDLLLVSGGTDPGVTAYRTDDGTEVWSYPGAAFIGGYDGSIAVMAAQYGRVAAVDVVTGTERWTFGLPPMASAGGAVVSGSRVYVGASYPSAGSVEAPVVHALDAATGALVWRTTLDEGTDLQWSPPVLASGLVLVADSASHPGSAPTTHLHALDAGSGDRRWSADLGSDVAGYHDVRPLLTRDSAYVVTPPGTLVAVDLATGQERWRIRSESGLPLASGPVEGHLLVALGDRVSSVDPATGSERWSVPARVRYGQSWTVLTGDVLFAVEAGRTLAVSVTSGRVLWETPVETAQAPAWSDRTLYLAGPERLVAVDTADGSVRWAAAVRAQPWSATQLAGDRVIVPAADGTVTAVLR